jgi:hypothetical protein
VIRISASDLESYRWWKDSEEADLALLVRRLKHEEPPSPQMGAGRAFAKVFEHAKEANFDAVSMDGWHFRFELDATLALPPVRELKAEMLVDTPSGPVMLVGMVDSLDGTVVRDQKLTERWDAEKYFDSLQWRCYLLMFKAQTFIYDIFVGKYDGQEVTVNDYHRLSFYAYPRLKEDVEAAVAELASVIIQYVPELVK